MSSQKKQYQTEYGYFNAEGNEYVITQPNTPRPWVNVICPGDYGIVVAQSGSGYSWRTHASLNRITRWNQDLLMDNWGKYLYFRDEETGEIWSPTLKPSSAGFDSFECRHGFGYTKFTTAKNGIQAELTLFVPPSEPLEIWDLKLKNLSGKARKISVWSYMEWCLGEGPDSHREFHKTFIDTEIKDNVIFASKRLWTISNAKGQAWNRNWEYVAWHAASNASEVSGSKDAFIGQNGTLEKPNALVKGQFLGKTTGKWDDGIGSIRSDVSLAAGAEESLSWTVGCAKTQKEAEALSKKYLDSASIASAFKATGEFWNELLSRSDVQTPDAGFNLLGGRWLKYQAISGRIWGRTGYYQAGGAIGYRDQLQDSQIFLHLETERTKRQILLHAIHQYKEGIVYHWWHPITEDGHKSGYSDDLLWLPFVVVNYLKETGDFSILKEKVPFLKEKGDKKEEVATVFEHCVRAIAVMLKRRSKRGLPLIGTGDWNDGLSTTGWDGKGETVWVAQFLYGILDGLIPSIEKAVEKKVLPSSELKKVKLYQTEMKNLYKAVNGPGWDGKYYWAASTDDGTLIGSEKVKQGKIHLNTQTWAILYGLAPKERIPSMLQAVEKYLYRDYGPLLLYPAYSIPDERIGYLTRYAPGVRENGGLYTHAGTWAIQMECFLKRHEMAWDLFEKISPVHRGMEPNLYVSEPYVTPGNVDGPDSPNYGRGGWTWYTGSAAWLYRIMMEWVIGVRPEWDGLKVDPCVPKSWNEFSSKRVYRGKVYHFHFTRSSKLAANSVEIQIDGKKIEGNTIPATKPSSAKSGESIQVKVLFS